MLCLDTFWLFVLRILSDSLLHWRIRAGFPCLLLLLGEQMMVYSVEKYISLIISINISFVMSQ